MSEFQYIKWLKSAFGEVGGKLKKSIGDDCAVIEMGKLFQIITTDMLVDGDHFKLQWSTPKQIGIKAMEVSKSDIAAMGGIPKYALVSLCLTGREEKDFVKKLYEGIGRAAECGEFGEIRIIGGDITHGDLTVINVTMIGEVEKHRCVFRSGAKVGDLICVTGNLGGSWAGLMFKREKTLCFPPFGNPLSAKWFESFVAHETQNSQFEFFIKSKNRFKKSIDYCLKKHLEPEARLKKGRILSQYASAMIDVSDGLGSEVRHIAEESGVGAVVYEEKIPIAKEVREMGRFLSHEDSTALRDYGAGKLPPPNLPLGKGEELALGWALSGGEDFELVFTISKENAKKLKKEMDFFVVGEIIKGKKCYLIDKNGEKKFLPGGYEHKV